MPAIQNAPLAAPAEEEAALVDRAAAGDVQAVRQIIKTYNQRLYRLVRAVLRSNADAEEVLQEAAAKEEQLSFSKHAQVRMAERDIALTQGDMLRLQDAVGRASQKGIQKTLVLMDRRAFIVSVPDNTVVTAMEGCDIKENVFTQIDGAVII